MGCVWCEGAYLTPKKRLDENPRLTIHVKCFQDMIRTQNEQTAILKYLSDNQNRDVLIKSALERSETFWKRMEQIDKLSVGGKET